MQCLSLANMSQSTGDSYGKKKADVMAQAGGIARQLITAMREADRMMKHN
jgi:hypothetical protein